MADDYRAWVITVINSMHITHHRDYEDLVQIGMLGIAEALKSYKPGYGTFPTYASYRIRNTLIDWFRKHYVPRSVHNYAKRVLEANGRLRAVLLRPPTHIEVAEYLKVPFHEHIERVERINQHLDHSDPLDDPEPTPDPFDLAATAENRRRIRSQLLKLPRKTRRVIIAYHYLDKNFKEIAKDMGLSTASANNIYRRGIRLLWQRLW